MKLFKYISAIILVILFQSCSKDWLETEQLTEKDASNYYSSPIEAQEALTGCYDALQLIYADGVAFPLASNVMSDLTFGGTGDADAENFRMIDQFDNSVSPSDLNVYEGNWKQYYKGIFRVNSLLQNYGNIEWGNQTDLQKYIEAEARFLRAYFYFDMVRLWGRVPLLTEPSQENVPQSEPDAIYAQIAKDLIFAIENGREQVAISEFGHASKWAAEGLLARVYLYYTGYYGKDDLLGLVSKNEVLGYLEDAINNSGHDLVPNFYDLWPAAAQYQAVENGGSISNTTYAGETNSEIVFSIKYTYTSDWDGNTDGNHWMVMNGLREMSYPEYGYGSGWGGSTVVPEFFQAWNDSDDRKLASVMAIEEEGIDFTKIGNTREYTGYFTKKYTPLCDSAGNSTVTELGGVSFMISQYQDFFVIRFSDVLLMAAELGSPNALDYINRVRTRAGLEPAASADKDAIYEERKYEFAFEGIRYWDLLRYDNTLQYAADKLNYSGSILDGGAPYEKNISGELIKTTRGLSQIPYNQITLSGGVLTQNPGW